MTGETHNFYKLRGLSLSGLAASVVDEQVAPRLSMNLIRALSRSRRFVPKGLKDLAVFVIMPVAMALIDYASGFSECDLLELPSRKCPGQH